MNNNNKKIKMTVRELKQIINEIITEELSLLEQASTTSTSLSTTTPVKSGSAATTQITKDIEKTIRNAEKIAMSPTVQQINKKSTEASAGLTSALNEPDPVKRVQRLNKAAQDLQTAAAQATGVAKATGTTGATGITGTSTRTTASSTVSR